MARKFLIQDSGGGVHGYSELRNIMIKIYILGEMILCITESYKW